MMPPLCFTYVFLVRATIVAKIPLALSNQYDASSYLAR